MTSDKQLEKESAVTGFGMLVQTNEGEQLTYDDPKPVGTCSRKVARKLLKLRGTLKNYFETIRSETQRWGRSETIIGASVIG